MDKSLRSSFRIIFPLVILFVNSCNFHYSFADQDLEECNNWKQYSEWAQTSKLPNFQLKEDTIFYYESNENVDWDEARKSCSIKFGGSYYADLIQFNVGSKQIQEKTKQFLETLEEKELIKNGDKFPMAGVCCRIKSGVLSTENTCEWISGGNAANLVENPNLQICQIIEIQYLGSNPFKFTTNNPDNSNTYKGFICSYSLPKNIECNIITSTVSSTTEKVTQNIGTEKTTKKTSERHETSTIPPFDTIGPIYNSNTSIKEDLENIHKEIDTITQSDADKLLEISSKLKVILNTKPLQTNDTLFITMDIINRIEDLSTILKESKQLLNFSANIIESMSRVIDYHNAWDQTQQINEKVKMSSNILKYIQKTGFSLGCREDLQNETIKIKKTNIVLKTFVMNYNHSTHFNVTGKDSYIDVPAGIPQPQFEDKCMKGTAVGSMFDKLSRYLSAHLDENHEINSNIVAFSIQNKDLNSTRLPDGIPPIKIMVEHNMLLEFGDTVQCVFWNFNQNKWSSEGCRFQQIGSNRKLSVCECNHLTNFAALMDVSGRETNTKAKDILTKVCCGLSIICLLLTLGFLTLVRALRNRRNNITCNLCFCLFMVNLLVVFGMDRTENNAICQTVAALLLYFILCSFSWMLMEGYHLYQMIVLVFSNVGHLRLIYLYAIGYGAPLLISFSAYLGIGFKNLKEFDSYFCWISSPSHPYRVWAVAVPAIIAILANSMIMFLALKEAFSAKIKKKMVEKDFSNDSMNISEKLSQSFSWIKGFISLIVLLGITWISFLLYIHSFGQFFSYIFIILNGIQGVFIFVFQILLNEKARNVVKKTYKKKRVASRYLSSLYRTTSTNVFTSTSRSKSLSRDKSSDNINGCNSGSANFNTMRSNNSAKGSISSHMSQSISMNRIRNASDSILF